MDESDSFKACIEQKIAEADKLLLRCKSALNIETGRTKLQKKIEAELKFLKRLSEHPDQVGDDNVRCSNLSHLTTLLNCALSQKGVTELLQPFPYFQADGSPGRVIVDVVADYGRMWIKVVARNPQAVLQSSLGEGEFGRRTLLEQLKDLLECSQQHRHFYQSICVKVYFSAGSLIQPLRDLLEEIGVELMEDLPGAEPPPSPSEALMPATKDMNGLFHVASIPAGSLLNLDVSCMITFVSNLTNGSYQLRFPENILTEQAQREAKSPVKPELDVLFQGRSLMCTQCALQDFLTILDTIGGFHEKERASQLISRLRVVPDQPSARALALETKSKIKLRSKIIFGTGDTYKAITVTSNGGFLRSALAQGIKFEAYVHESRALTEAKECFAVPCNHSAN